MPRLSSHSMRSTASVNSGASSTPPMSHDHYGSYGLSRKPSTSSGDTDPNATYGLMRQTSQVSNVSAGQYGMLRGNTPPGMSRPAQRPPSPPLPNPPQMTQQQMGPVYGTRAQPDMAAHNVYGSRAAPDNASVYGTRAGKPQTIRKQSFSQSTLCTAPDSVYMSRGQVQQQQQKQDPVYGTRGNPSELSTVIM